MGIPNYIYLSILSVCFLTGLACYKSFHSPSNIILAYVIITFFTEMVGHYSLYLSPEKKINALLYNIYLPIGYLLLSLFFSKIIEKKMISKVILAFIPIVVAIIIFKSNTLFRFYPQLYLFSKATLIVYSIAYFHQILAEENDIYSNPHFWTVTGILFFYTGYFFLSGFIIYISQKDLELASKLFTINHLLNIIYYSLVTYGFICQRRLARS